MDQSFRNQVEIILGWRNLHHLKPLFTSMHHIPERVYEYNSNLFVVFNTQDQKYEIHSIEQGPGANSRQCQLEYDELDVRTLHFIWENDLRVHGWAIFDRIEKSEQDAKARKNKQFRNDTNAWARETQSLFARDLGWGDGGKLQFQVALKPKKMEAGVHDSRTARDGKSNTY